MSKCQKNKYAAGGKCGSMSGPEREPCAKNSEVSSNFAALLASREKQDFLFNTTQPQSKAPESKHKPSTQQAIVSVKKIAKSDIDTILDGDF